MTPIRPSQAPAQPTISPPAVDQSEAIKAALGQIAQASVAHASSAASQAAAGAVRGAALGVFQAIASLLAVRMLLLLSLIGGFVLAYMALQLGSYQAGGVLVAYAVLIVIPLIWLEKNPRVGGSLQ